MYSTLHRANISINCDKMPSQYHKKPIPNAGWEHDSLYELEQHAGNIQVLEGRESD